MTRTATTSTDILPVLRERWSPWAFDQDRVLSSEELTSMLEAARWTSSSNNSQPWRFIVGHRGDVSFGKIFNALNAGNRLWAGAASALLVAVAATTDNSGKPLDHSDYDLGAAVTQLVVQAHGLHLHAHQIGGFQANDLRGAFSIPEQWSPRSVVAIGAVGDHAGLPENLQQRFSTPRQRLDISELAFAGRWGQSAIETE